MHIGRIFIVKLSCLLVTIVSVIFVIAGLNFQTTDYFSRGIEEKINYVLYSEINPSLASHGGEVSLVEVVDKETAVLQFGGGCQGCGMVDLTLKDGVEKTLLEQVDGLKGVMDVTDHSYRENAYYK